MGFLPVTVCTGYLAGWFTNLHGFRERSIVERLFWSVPLSFSVSTIAAVLIGKFLSLSAITGFFLLSALLFLIIGGLEWLGLRRNGRQWTTGFQPLGATALIVALIWFAGAILVLVDFQSGQRLYLSLPFYDHGARTNWAASVLRTGVPPDNPLYFYKHSASLRYYYFWLVDCAAVAGLWRLPARVVMTASCVWSGFGLAALLGLYLKHFLGVGARLRTQFLISVSLLSVGGVFIVVNLWKFVVLHIPPPAEAWSAIQIPDWWSILMFYPHHVASLVCVMFAFLLAWLAVKESPSTRARSAILIGAAFASAFGLSVYVACAFFLVVVAWSVWRLAIEHEARSVLQLAFGGACAFILLLPYLFELKTGESKVYGGSVLAFSVRETIPTHGLLELPVVRQLAMRYPNAAENIARVILLPPAGIVELGFFLLILAIYVLPDLRDRNRLTSAQRALVFLVVATFPVTSLIRSGVLSVNDFGLHSSMFMQFPLLLLASEVLMSWRFESRKVTDPQLTSNLPRPAREWLRSLAVLTIVLGIVGTSYRALVMRFLLPVAESQISVGGDPRIAELSHKAYLSQVGYAHLDATIPRDAIVQFNATDEWIFWKNTDLVNVDHQIAIAGGALWCGSELGGDPSGCPAMGPAIDAVFKDASGDQAQSICRSYGIQYLVANVYDPVWKDNQSWVWTLTPVVADPEFRVLDCRDRLQGEKAAK